MLTACKAMISDLISSIKRSRTPKIILPDRDDDPILSELFNLEQLARYAKALASKHEIGTGLGQDQLLPKLAENERILIHCYEQLNAAVCGGRGVSPAGEWLLDNFHAIEEQIRTARRHLPIGYSRELPHLVGSGLYTSGIPRIYDIALAIIAHSDGRVDSENTTAFVDAYQMVTPLTLGEFWALPIMLRLALIGNLRRVAARVVVGLSDRNRAIHWQEQLFQTVENDPKNLIVTVADMARTNPPMSNSFVAELARTMHGHSPSFDIAITWLENQLSVTGRTTLHCVQLEVQQQAANQLSVSDSIGGLRFLGAMDWREFVESLGFVDKHLTRDPANIYSLMDFATRDQYRHVIERLSKKSTYSEWEIAHEAVKLAEQGFVEKMPNGRFGHVGYYLVGRGLPRLKKTLRDKSTQHAQLKFLFNTVLMRSTGWLYFFSLTLITVALAGFIGHVLYLESVALPTEILVMSIVLLCTSQMAMEIVNRAVTLFKSPQLLPRLDFSRGIPSENRTLVAVPSMLVSQENIASLLEGIEIRYLANREQNLHFALLTDFVDAPNEKMPADEALCRAVCLGVDTLNERYRNKDANGGDIFFLLHRSRVWNAHDKVWMGYERKRGKLEALNELLIARNNGNYLSVKPPERRPETFFSVIAGNIAALPNVKYVITLDTDTMLPRDAAHKLVGTMAHPLNHPVLSESIPGTSGRIVIEGFSILQPRVAVSLPGSQRSWFVRLYAGDPGIDPYTRAVSDVYQDLFQEGSFIGKGIYDVHAFTQSLSGALPENLILSHDLLEGCYSRCGLVSDVLLYEEHISHFAEDASRRSRWIRGDWQIISWIFPTVPSATGARLRNPLSRLSKWKIFDNLRRSFIPIATLALLLFAWFSQPNHWYLTCVILVLQFVPAFLASLNEFFRKSEELDIVSHLQNSLWIAGKSFATSGLSLVFLPFDAVVNLNSICKSLVRMAVTHKSLLAWRSSTDPRNTIDGGLAQFYRFMIAAPAISLVVLGALINGNLLGSSALGVAFPFLAFWLVSPGLAYFLSRNIPPEKDKLTPPQISNLHRIARKTWQFFETFVGPDDNWLPPDNFQEYPAPVIAHRTSPTNIGLSLLANLSAFDFGYLSMEDLLERTSNTFCSMEKLERFKGHFYNWYDTQSLKPLHPRYVSTVDSGNLSGLLLTLRPGLIELSESKVIPTAMFLGLKDSIAVFLDSETSSPVVRSKFMGVLRSLENPPETLSESISLANQLKLVLTDLKNLAQKPPDILSQDAQLSIHLLLKQCQSCLDGPLDTFAPWSRLNAPKNSQSLSKIFDLNRMPTIRDVAQLESNLLPLIDNLLRDDTPDRIWLLELRGLTEQASRFAAEAMATMAELAQRCEELATVEYGFLYSSARRLLAIGYNVTEHRRDDGYYDLLASEARLGSFVAIAQGLLPQEHWFALGRLLTAWKGEPTLLSWSGSMFEYLMPLLVMPTFKNTLLDQTYETSIKRQIEYGAQRGVPWGISESGYNSTDLQLNYQYSAFGVPGLGFKRGLAEDLVIAPYASIMAVMIAPTAVSDNMQRMTDLGFEGRYGFYEAIDYTPSRLRSDQNHVIIHSYMAHHQGMSFMALAYQLLGQKMQRRFQSDPQFQATELLLHERVPKAAMLYPHAPEVSNVARLGGEVEVALRVLHTPHTPRPEVHLLSNGRYSVMLTNSGGGYSRWNDLAVSRWREDPTCDNWGTFCYIRDVDSGAVWSAAHQPTLAPADDYKAIFPLEKAEFRRKDHDIEMHTEITVSAEDDIELRRFTFKNLSSHRRTIEFTSYCEVVLAPQSNDEAHPAFSNLFVQTEIIAGKQAILCTRRPRSDHETTPTMIHLMAVHGTITGEISYETDRSHFIGRGRSVIDPIVMDADFGSKADPSGSLGGHDGSVLDPIVAIRCRVQIEPDQTARVHMITGIGQTRAAALDLVEIYHDRHIADRVFSIARTHRQVALQLSNVMECDSLLYIRLANSIIYTNPLYRAAGSILTKNRRGQSALWGQGISGDLPIFLLKIASQDGIEIVRQLVQAHGFWRRMNLIVDLVIWNEEDTGYRQDLNDRITSIVAAENASLQVDKAGGIFVRRPEQLSEEDRILVQTIARAVFTDAGGTLEEQIDRRIRSPAKVRALIPLRTRGIDKLTDLLTDRSTNSASEKSLQMMAPPASKKFRSDLLFQNSLGGFSADGREYQITTTRSSVTPAPWVNVIANPYFGTVVSEAGSAYTWCENAHEFRLTPWKNDAISDGSGECFYLRDEESGEFWSPCPWPLRGSGPYTTIHGFGYSAFRHTNIGIKSELTTFVAVDAPVKIVILKLRNVTGRPRRISVTGYCEWVLGELRSKSLLHVTTEIDPTNSAIFARNPFHPDFGARVAFFDTSEKVRTVTGDRSEFIGRNGHSSAPSAMSRAHLSGRVGAAMDSCAAMQTIFEFGEDQERELVFILGVGSDEADARTLIRRFGSVSSAQLALQEVKTFWNQIVGCVQIKTPDPSIDVLANGWLTYQTLSSRMWARSGFYQSGGAFGFRDQLQDAMALLHIRPRLLRDHIIRCAGHQFLEGDVQHWWHPPSGRGVRTHFSDDYLWLPLATSRYVLGIGDYGILDKSVTFVEGRQLKPDEEAYCDLHRRSERSATVYEHCVLAIKRVQFGQYGLPLIGCGDWNDGMNLVGEHGKGESVWLAFFLYEVLQKFSEVAKKYGDNPFAASCLTQAELLTENIEKHGWDGEWYRRAYFDGGQPLGSKESDECQIDSLPQSWAVLSGAGDSKRARQGMMAVDRRLVDRNRQLVKLFDPPFDKSALNPGYIKGYVPGVRENGGQYTHAAIWNAMAFAALGDKERAWEILAMINPLNHAATPEGLARYKVEPYAVAADVYAVEPHAGRGGWTWYTGSAGWMYRLILESLLGIRLEIDTLFFAPCVPDTWTEFQVNYCFRSTMYEIIFQPALTVGKKGLLTVDGVAQTEKGLRLIDDQGCHKIEVSY